MLDNPQDSRHIPPHSIEAERSVLGALLLDPQAFHKVMDSGLVSEDFYREAHSKIFDAIYDIHTRSEPVDLITLTATLKNKNLFEQVGGSAYLTGLFEDSYSSAHVNHYAKIVKEKAVLRKMISTAMDLIDRAYTGVDDFDEYLDLSEKAIFDVTDSKLRNSFSSIKDILIENMQNLQELAEKKSNVTGLTTGFRDLDEKTSGLHPGNLVIIAGRPAMGKTSFVLSMAERAALKSKASVALFSLEMAKEELGVRLLTGLAKVDAHKLKTGKLNDRDWRAITKAAGTLGDAKIYIDDTPAITVLEMRSRCRRLLSESGLSLIIVDYLQLMRGTKGSMKGGGDTREREISEISRSLKALAKELRVPVIALSQLNRGVESRPDKRPMLSDLRECVVGDTLVVLADGRCRPIRELVGQCPEVISVDSNRKLITAKTDLVWSVGKKRTLKVCLASGREIIATEKHRLLGFDGWKQIRELTAGNRIALVVGDYARILSDEGLRSTEDDVFWDRIVSIEDAGEQEVFDLTVPGPSSWLADGIVSHNSGAIEQDADIVAFVYRDEVYNKETPDQGIAEIILAKHRAGSTGTIRLAWQAEYTAFEDLAPEYISAGADMVPHQGLQDPRQAPQPPQNPGRKLDLPSF
ncbi:MAG: replicative DNA helicase [Bacteriovoracia bacterium]